MFVLVICRKCFILLIVFKILVYDLQTKASYKMSLGNFFVYIIVLFLLYFVLFCILYYILELFYYVSRYSIFSFNNLKTNH